MKKSSKHVGKSYHRLTIIEALPNSNFGNAMVKARCVCFVEKDYILNNILTGRTKSCGCMRKDRHNRPAVLASMIKELPCTLQSSVNGGAFVYKGQCYEVVKAKLH